MRHIAIAEFKDRVSEIVSAVEAGEEVIITRDGRPAAKLIAATDDRAERKRAAIANLMALREELRERGVTATMDEIIAWKNEGQR